MNVKIQLHVKGSSSTLCGAFEKVPIELSSHRQLCYHRKPVSCNQPKIGALGGQQALSHTLQAAAAGWAGARVPHLLLLSQKSTRSTISKGVPNTKSPCSFLPIFFLYFLNTPHLMPMWIGDGMALPSVLESKDTSSFTGTIMWRNVSLTRKITENKIAEKRDMGGERAQLARCLWARMST